MKVVGLDTITRDGVQSLDFYTEELVRNGTIYTAHVTISLRDLHHVIVQAAQNKTRRCKRGPVRVNNARVHAPVIIDAAPVAPAVAALP